MKQKSKPLIVKTEEGIQVIVGRGWVSLLNLAQGQSIILTSSQARALGLEKEAVLTERMKDEQILE